MFRWLVGGYTPTIPGGIATLEKVTLGGYEQWINIRGQKRDNPVLLFVHGGPGASDLGALRHYTAELERHFTVVHWTQRGASKSYRPDMPVESLHVEQLVSDGLELTELLLKRFGKRLLVLVGHSMGTLIGVYMVQRRPELFSAYVGVNQIVDRAAEELISYRHCLAVARARGNRKAVAELESIGEPVGGLYPTMQGTLTHKKWLRDLGALTHDPAIGRGYFMRMLFASELTWGDRVRFFKALMINMEALWPEICRRCPLTEVPALQVPVYVVAGADDHNTSPDLAARFVEQLDAPVKECVLFPNSGHLACYEEPQRFTELMLRVRGAHCEPVLAQVG